MRCYKSSQNKAAMHTHTHSLSHTQSNEQRLTCSKTNRLWSTHTLSLALVLGSAAGQTHKTKSFSEKKRENIKNESLLRLFLAKLKKNYARLRMFFAISLLSPSCVFSFGRCPSVSRRSTFALSMSTNKTQKRNEGIQTNFSNDLMRSAGSRTLFQFSDVLVCVYVCV